METQNHLLVSNSQFQHSQKRLEEKRSEVKIEEEEKNLKEEEKKNIVRETSQVVQAIKNIFARCQATMRIKPQLVANRESGLADVLAFNLDVIHARIIDLKEIADEYSNSATAEHSKGDSGGAMTNAPTDMREQSTSSAPTTNATSLNQGVGKMASLSRTPRSKTDNTTL